jgi:hypothetical protein
MLSGRLQQAPGGVEVRRYLSTLLLQMLALDAKLSLTSTHQLYRIVVSTTGGG